MPNFMFVYHGGSKPETPEEGEAMMAKWYAWIADNEDVLVNPGSPVGMSKTVSSSGIENNGGSNPVMGFSVVSADDIDAACALAATNPSLEMKGASIEVAEIFEMDK